MRAIPRWPPEAFGVKATRVAKALLGKMPGIQTSLSKAASSAAAGMESKWKASSVTSSAARNAACGRA